MANVKNNSAFTVEDVRHFIYDRVASDSPVLMDLAFSNEEIQNAMRFCCISYNSILPYVENITPDRIPNNIAFIHGIIYHLYLAKWGQLIRQDLDYTAGNTSVEHVKRWIAHLEAGMKLHKAEFDKAAKDRKIAKNLESAYGCVG